MLTHEWEALVELLQAHDRNKAGAFCTKTP